MDWVTTHQKAKAVLPAQELPPRRYWVGVLHHSKSPDEELLQQDFLWILAYSVSSILLVEHAEVDLALMLLQSTRTHTGKALANFPLKKISVEKITGE
jgi:hypothetical protein